jgi:hypothetical protein
MLIDKIYPYLSGIPGVVAIVGQRIWPDRLKQGGTGETVVPAIVYQDISTIPAYSHSGNSGLDDAVYQFACWAKTPLEAHALAAQVRAVFDGVTTVVNGTMFTAFVDGSRSSPDAETGLERVLVDVSFQHQ